MTYNLFQYDKLATCSLRIVSSSSQPLLTSSCSQESEIKQLITTYIKPEWTTVLKQLYDEERVIIEKRRSLLTNFREQLAIEVQPILDSLPESHPELFI